jgi:mannose-6-phosphate isomerase-like protein (cupin superfamily)
VRFRVGDKIEVVYSGSPLYGHLGRVHEIKNVGAGQQPIYAHRISSTYKGHLVHTWLPARSLRLVERRK